MYSLHKLKVQFQQNTLKYFHSVIFTVYRCQCGHCVNMPSVEECVCCKELDSIVNKMEGRGIECITQDNGFQAVCLNPDVLETAYYAYRERYGGLAHPVNE